MKMINWDKVQIREIWFEAGDKWFEVGRDGVRKILFVVDFNMASPLDTWFVVMYEGGRTNTLLHATRVPLVNAIDSPKD